VVRFDLDIHFAPAMDIGGRFFLRHLIDADAASNTLSWRWVAVLQTAEKTYLATTDNIARYTGGRFAPTGLASQATALTEPPVGPVRMLPKAACIEPGQPAILLVTPEDMHPESLFCDQAAICAAIVVTDSHWHTGDASRRFVDTAVADTVARTKAHFGCTANACKTLSAEKLITVANAAGVKQILTPYAPVGPVADALSGVTRQLAEEGSKWPGFAETGTSNSGRTPARAFLPSGKKFRPFCVKAAFCEIPCSQSDPDTG
jgi:deoxyribodipyrimidine photo-lyase